MQLHLQIESLTAGQKLLAAKPPSPLIPAAGTESPRLKVTSPREENSSSLCPTQWPVELSSSEMAGARKEVLWAAPSCGQEHHAGTAASPPASGSCVAAVGRAGALFWSLQLTQRIVR